MCGIVGYIGFEDVKDIILGGLEKLEYRGYDSAGIAVLHNNEVYVCKEKGRISDLRKNIDKEITGTVGIGHTRWATHGIPNKINSHPHQSSSKRFTLVHNGIIENEEELKEKYLKGIELQSDTDTEVIVQLLEKFVNDDEETELAIRHTMSELKGSYALAIIDKKDMNTLYAAKNKTPILAGKGIGFNMVGSDAMAMINHTNLFYEIEDKEFLKITKDNIEIYTIYGNKVNRQPYKADIDASDTEKGTYPHYMMKEIEEQPFVIRKIMSEYSDKCGNMSISPEILQQIRYCDKINIIACGTSYHAGLLGKQFFEKISHKPAEVILASEFNYNMPLLTEKPLFMFVSQSGETADCRAVLVKVKEMGYKTLTLTNVKGSTLSREADQTLLLHAGPEIAVASTKAYTAQITVLAILAALVENKIGMDVFKELSKIAYIMETLCNDRDKYKILAKEFLLNSRNCFYIGRSMDYFLCLEAALKLKEISYIQTEGFPAGELKHGTIALIEKDTPVIAVITQENINLNTRSNIKEVKARGAKTMVISMRKISQEKDHIVIDDANELLSPLAAIIPVQYLAYYAALLKGCDIDKPRNLAKSVTVE
ncbi:MAG TPA: glutamine--fructose-6-phosphate transaminase (isomerizing) [Sedimentibacter sp.]|nr:glutamine--fructose-6-phosphate transaminase (isomerizing) [Sedimentibacter sp.]HNZ82781.1 glutamine--fructose-6-phosphate transaminase (isomerizing) [Sedimentibacter sp.]HOH69538.1 glutamine--fructose-6-phosphate transaminase (isomerizing) [Sedimentibacter sp.]HPW99261.1 glutamine--fructose-6-phosphate transaminase (isomerizing) [Sedimentibacter sp.]